MLITFVEFLRGITTICSPFFKVFVSYFGSDDDIKVPKDFGYEPEKWVPDLNYPKTSDKIGATATKKEEMVYSGERRLVGIATMHKSNQVPVFADDDDVSGRKKATEITLMKGNK